MLLNIQTTKSQAKQTYLSINKARKQEGKKKKKTKIKAEMKEKSLELNISKQKLLDLILTVPLSQIYSQSNKKMISNLKTQKSRFEKALIKIY